MPTRADGYQATAGFTSDASLYDVNIATGYERSSGGLNYGITGRLDLGASPLATKQVKFYAKWIVYFAYIVEYSSDGVTWTAAVGTGTAPTGHSGAYVGQSLTWTLTTATVAQYWRVSVEELYGGRIGLMELECLDATGHHITEYTVSGVMAAALIGVGLATSNSTQATMSCYMIGAGVLSSNGSIGGKGMQLGLVGACKLTSAMLNNLSMSVALVGAAVFTHDMIGGNASLQCALVGGNDITSEMNASNAGMSVALRGAGVQGAQSGLTVIAQPFFDFDDWFPGIGDPNGFTDGKPYQGKYSGAYEMRAGKVLRAAAWGLEFNDTKSLANGTVELKETVTGEIRGSGASTKIGQYLTGTPAGRGGKAHTLTAKIGTSNPTSGFSAKARKRERTCFKVTQPASLNMSADVSVVGRQYRAYTTSSDILLGKNDSLDLKNWTDADTGINGANPCIRIERQSTRQRLYMFYESGSDVVRQQSDNDGGTWSGLTTIATNGKHPELRITAQGTYHYFWVDSGTIKCIIKDAFDNVIVDTFTAVGSGVDDDSIAATDDVLGGGVWRIALYYRSSSNPTVVTSTDGVNFS